MADVDLNPVRAGLAATPEGSDYTSIQSRVGAVPPAPVAASAATPDAPSTELPPVTLDEERLRPEAALPPLPRAALMPFDATAETPWAIPFAFDDYLELVDWTGRALAPGKRGQIPAGQPRILDRLGIHGEQFITYAERLLNVSGSAVGAPAALVDLCARRQTKYLRGISAARALFARELAA
jgi:hypothetical protein